MAGESFLVELRDTAKKAAAEAKAEAARPASSYNVVMSTFTATTETPAAAPLSPVAVSTTPTVPEAPASGLSA